MGNALRVLVIVMGLMIVTGITVLATTVIGRVAHHPAPPPAKFAAPPIELPRGARIANMTAGPDRLVLALDLADGGRQLVIVDLASGRELGTIELRAAP